MSSFIGHTLNTVGVYTHTQPHERRGKYLYAMLWLGWLCFVGLAPDLDYVLPPLYASRMSIATGMRITHSLVGALLFLLLTIGVLTPLKLKPAVWRAYSIQVILVGLSHLVMDMLVGVWPLPLLWPFSDHRFKIPFGILPSAPSFRLDNPYMYRNVAMELGIIIPLYAGLYLWKHTDKRSRIGAIMLWGLALGCMAWAFTLAR